MLHSMTGFARESAETGLGTLTWELRAVNHRYLDVQFKLPEELRPLEAALRKQVAHTLSRGKVECALHFRRAFDQQADLQINGDLVELIGRRIKEMSADLPATGAVNPFDVLRWPGVVQQGELDTEPLFEQASKLLDATLAAMQSMRSSEGARIADMLESRCTDIAAISESVRLRMPEVLQAARQKQRERNRQRKHPSLGQSVIAKSDVSFAKNQWRRLWKTATV